MMKVREDEAVPVFVPACCSLGSWLMQFDASTCDAKPQQFALVFWLSQSPKLRWKFGLDLLSQKVYVYRQFSSTVK